MLIIRNTLGSGRLVGLAAVAGVQIGLVVHTLLAITGISLLIRSSRDLFFMLVIAGSLYLCWLGLQAFIRPLGLMHFESIATGSIKSFRDAMITNLLNPKALLLFLAVMPGFVVSESALSHELQLLVLATMLLAVNVVWQTMLVYVSDYIGQRIASGFLSVMVSRVCGCFLLFFGILLFVDNIHAF